MKSVSAYSVLVCYFLFLSKAIDDPRNKTNPVTRTLPNICCCVADPGLLRETRSCFFVWRDSSYFVDRIVLVVALAPCLPVVTVVIVRRTLLRRLGLSGCAVDRILKG